MKPVNLTELNFSDLKLTFHTPNALTRWRVDTLLIKEPVTVEWISSFTKNDVFVDVGANVGMYAVLAGALAKCRVYAFEPMAENRAVLLWNVVGNGLLYRVLVDDRALSDRDGFGELHLSSQKPGSSCHALNDKVDGRGQAFDPVFSQPCEFARLDTLINQESVSAPTRVKIDVDGFEPAVVRGIGGCLKTVRSMLVEVNPALVTHRFMVSGLCDEGFRFDPAQVRASTRAGGPFQGVAEYLFFR